MKIQKFSKGNFVYIEKLGVTGHVLEISQDGKTTKVLTENGTIEVATNLVQLWDLLSWFVKLIVVLFKKK